MRCDLFATNGACFAPNLKESTAKFFDGLQQDFQSIHRQYYPNPGDEPSAAAKEHKGKEALAHRYRQLQRASTKIEGRLQKVAEIQDLESMLKGSSYDWKIRQQDSLEIRRVKNAAKTVENLTHK